MTSPAASTLELVQPPALPSDPASGGPLRRLKGLNSQTSGRSAAPLPCISSEAPGNQIQRRQQRELLQQTSAPLVTKPFMGPAWPDVMSLPAGFMRDMAVRGTCYQSELTIHHYGLSNRSAGLAELLDERGMRVAMQKLKAYVQEANSAGYNMRLTELNSMIGGGMAGVSDTYGAALWTLDAIFEAAAVGVSGVNFHCESITGGSAPQHRGGCTCLHGCDRQGMSTRACCVCVLSLQGATEAPSMVVVRPTWAYRPTTSPRTQ